MIIMNKSLIIVCFLPLIILSGLACADDDLSFNLNNESGSVSINISSYNRNVYVNSSLVLNVVNNLNVSDEVSLKSINISFDSLFSNWTLSPGNTGRTFLKFRDMNQSGLVWVVSKKMENLTVPVVRINVISRPLLDNSEKIDLKAGKCLEVLVRLNSTNDKNITVCAYVSEDQIGYSNVSSKLNETSMVGLQEAIRDYLSFLNQSKPEVICNSSSTFLMPVDDSVKSLLSELQERTDCTSEVNARRHEAVVYYQTILDGCENTREALKSNNQSLSSDLTDCRFSYDRDVGVYSRKISYCESSIFNETRNAEERVRNEEVAPWRIGAIIVAFSVVALAVVSHQRNLKP